MNRLIQSGPFIAGFTIATLLHSNNDLFWTFINPHKAATTNDRSVPVEIVPYNNKPDAVATSHDDSSSLFQNRTRDIMKHGYPSLDNIRVFDNYVLSYDRRNRVPNWVFEHFTFAMLKMADNVDRGKSEFKEDPMVHPYFRSTNEDYKKSGYDRGHMAAAANHRSSQKLMDQTFFLSNMAPQVIFEFYSVSLLFDPCPCLKHV